MSDLSPGAQRELAAMNARIYAMPEAEQQRWYDQHPLSMYTPAPTRDEKDAATLRAAADILRDRFGVLNCQNERLVLEAAAKRIEASTAPGSDR